MSRSHDCYCAICAGTMENLNLNIGESTEEAKDTRRQFIRVGPPAPQRNHQAWRAVQDSYEPHGYIEGSYDPEVLQGHDRSWLGELLCVVRDPDLGMPSQYYFSTEGWYSLEHWEVEGACHPDGLGDDHPIPLYDGHFYRNDETVTRRLGFPLHTHRAQVLASTIAGSTNIRVLDPVVMYQLMDALSAMTRLKLDYGNIQEDQNEHWACSVGEEYTLMSPLWPSSLPMNKDTACSLVLRHGADDKRAKSPGIERTISYSFGKLPPDLIDWVTNCLAVEDLFPLCQASMVVREATSRSGLWRRLFHKDMPWAVDVLSELVGKERATARENEEDSVDWMKAYTLFRRANAADAWGMEGDYLGLANRKRIWNVCEQIRVLYEARMVSDGKL